MSAVITMPMSATLFSVIPVSVTIMVPAVFPMSMSIPVSVAVPMFACGFIFFISLFPVTAGFFQK